MRKRNDGLSEFSIVGEKQVKNVLEILIPYLRLKRPQAILILEIIKKLPYTKSPIVLLETALLVDKVAKLTDGKKRTFTSDIVRQSLILLGHDV